MSNYILGEEEGETARLVSQSRQDPVAQKALWAGLSPGMRVVDAGCGPGANALTLASLVGPAGSVLGFDPSPARLEAARRLPPPPGAAPMSFEPGDVFDPPAAARGADFVYCQYVLEYLAERRRAVESLASLLRPGGILCLVDGDGIGVSQHPMPPEVEAGLGRLVEALARTGFDPYVGRKLFHDVVRAGLADVRVMVHPLSLTAGTASDEERASWRQRLVAMAPVAEPAFGGAEPYARFREAYDAMLADPESLKFVLVFGVRGVRR